MPMYTIMSGSFEIEPPLSHLELRRVPDLDLQEVTFKVDTEEIDTPDGLLIKRQASEVGPSHQDERVSNYRVEGELQRVITAFATVADTNEPRSFNGSIFCVYEEVGELRFIRLAADSNSVPTIDGVFRLEESDSRLVRKHPVISSWSEEYK